MCYKLEGNFACGFHNYLFTSIWPVVKPQQNVVNSDPVITGSVFTTLCEFGRYIQRFNYLSSVLLIYQFGLTPRLHVMCWSQMLLCASHLYDFAILCFCCSVFMTYWRTVEMFVSILRIIPLLLDSCIIYS